MSGVHEPTSPQDAMEMLDSRLPLLHSEKKLITYGLYDLGFREGAAQGRLAGIEAEKKRLKAIAVQLVADNPANRIIADTLFRIADMEASAEAVEALLAA